MVDDARKQAGSGDTETRPAPCQRLPHARGGHTRVAQAQLTASDALHVSKLEGCGRVGSGGGDHLGPGTTVPVGSHPTAHPGGVSALDALHDARHAGRGRSDYPTTSAGASAFCRLVYTSSATAYTALPPIATSA